MTSSFANPTPYELEVGELAFVCETASLKAGSWLDKLDHYEGEDMGSLISDISYLLRQLGLLIERFEHLHVYANTLKLIDAIKNKDNALKLFDELEAKVEHLGIADAVTDTEDTWVLPAVKRRRVD